MYVINVGFEIIFISNGVFPKSALPNGAFVAIFPGSVSLLPGADAFYILL